MFFVQSIIDYSQKTKNQQILISMQEVLNRAKYNHYSKGILYNMKYLHSWRQPVFVAPGRNIKGFLIDSSKYSMANHISRSSKRNATSYSCHSILSTIEHPVIVKCKVQ